MKQQTFEVPSEWQYQWPLSTLAGSAVSVTLADNGDLVDLSIENPRRDPQDLEAAELTAAIETYGVKFPS